jgi:hypothetical protein
MNIYRAIPTLRFSQAFEGSVVFRARVRYPPHRSPSPDLVGPLNFPMRLSVRIFIRLELHDRGNSPLQSGVRLRIKRFHLRVTIRFPCLLRRIVGTYAQVFKQSAHFCFGLVCGLGGAGIPVLLPHVGRLVARVSFFDGFVPKSNSTASAIQPSVHRNARVRCPLRSGSIRDRTSPRGLRFARYQRGTGFGDGSVSDNMTRGITTRALDRKRMPPMQSGCPAAPDCWR